PRHKSDHRRYGILGWALDTPVDMLCQQMAFHDPTLLLLGQFVKDPFQARADRSVEYLAPILRNQDHLLLAVPSGVRQALPCCFRHTVLLGVAQQTTRGELYSCNTQRCSSLTKSNHLTLVHSSGKL